MPPPPPPLWRRAGVVPRASCREGQRLGSRAMGPGEGRLDVARVRGLFPGLSDGLVHAEGPAGALLPENVVLAVAQAMRVPVADRGGVFPASARAEGLLASARTAVADLVGGVSTGVVLGPDPSRLTWTLARALARTWRPGDEVVVSRLDHDANVRPWVELAARTGVGVRWAEVDIETGELPDWQYDELLGPRTRLVAVTAASSAIGTRPDVAAIARRAHAVGALVYVDGTHAFALLAGVTAAVEHLASLDDLATGTRRDRLRASMAAVAAYERALFDWLDQALRAMRHVQVIGSAPRTTPTLSFTVAGMRPRQVAHELSRRGICAWDGDLSARELFDAFGLNEEGGAVQLGLMHYNTAEEVGYVIDAVAALRPR